MFKIYFYQLYVRGRFVNHTNNPAFYYAVEKRDIFES